MALDASNQLEHIFNVSMAPVFTFDLRNGSNIACTECFCLGQSYEDEAREHE